MEAFETAHGRVFGGGDELIGSEFRHEFDAWDKTTVAELQAAHNIWRALHKIVDNPYTKSKFSPYCEERKVHDGLTVDERLCDPTNFQHVRGLLMKLFVAI